jgi:hypothetical protein
MRQTVVGVAMGVLLAASPVWAADDCDRACLKTTLDQYLGALVKHDPNAAPLFAGFRQTENAVVKRPGTGLWQTMTAIGRFQRRYVDPVTGQAAFFGIIKEGDNESIVTVRLRVEQKRITEAEWYLGRRGDDSMNGPAQPNGQGGNLFDPDNLVANAPPDVPLPGAARVSREAMIAATNSYFDGITSHDGKIIMAAPGCPRFENGRTMAGRGNTPPPAAEGTPPPVGPQGRGAGGGPPLAADCTAGLETINIKFVAARRYPLVDEEAGVVLAHAVFIRPPGAVQRRNAFAEWFYFDRGKIKSIYSAMFYPPNDVPLPNWPPYEGNFPIPVTPPPAR